MEFHQASCSSSPIHVSDFDSYYRRRLIRRRGSSIIATRYWLRGLKFHHALRDTYSSIRSRAELADAALLPGNSTNEDSRRRSVESIVGSAVYAIDRLRLVSPRGFFVPFSFFFSFPPIIACSWNCYKIGY